LNSSLRGSTKNGDNMKFLPKLKTNTVSYVFCTYTSILTPNIKFQILILFELFKKCCGNGGTGQKSNGGTEMFTKFHTPKKATKNNQTAL